MVPKIRVLFSLAGEHDKEVDLAEITKKIGIAPTKTRTSDDWPDSIKDQIGLPDELKPHYTWQLDIGYSKNRLVRDRFALMKDLLIGKIETINELKKKYSLRASFTVGIHAQHDQHNLPELFLSQETIEFLASIGADIGFDMYLD